MSQPIAVLTGASQGIGEAIAKLFAKNNISVGLLARSKDNLTRVQHDIESQGGQAHAVVTDITDLKAIQRAAVEIKQHLGIPSILVNNAGKAIRKSFADITTDIWQQTLDVNLTGTFQVTQCFLPDIQSQHGRIINIASIAGKEGTAHLSSYCAAKHGVVGLTKALAKECKDISVTAICPGSVDTASLRDGMPELEPDMQPDDIANLALYLATKAPAVITGSCIDVFG